MGSVGHLALLGDTISSSGTCCSLISRARPPLGSAVLGAEASSFPSPHKPPSHPELPEAWVEGRSARASGERTRVVMSASWG